MLLFQLLLLHSLSLLIAKNGEQSEYVIIYPQNDSSAKNASFLLQNYIKNLTEVEVATSDDSSTCPSKSILVGQTSCTPNITRSFSQNSEDSFYLQTQGDTFIINGGTRGVHYGVMEILERFGGVRWYSNDFFVIPHLSNFSIDILDEEHFPHIPFRSIYIKDSSNSLAANETHSQQKTEVSNDVMNYYFRNNFGVDLPDEMGGSINFRQGLSNHTFFSLIPPILYFNENPGWFSMDENGERINDGQLCLTNTQLVSKFASNLIDIIRDDLNDTRYRNNKIRIYSISKNDNDKYCHCFNCRSRRRAKGENGYILEFINTIAQEVNKVSAFSEYDIYLETLFTDTTVSNEISPSEKVIPRFSLESIDLLRPLNESENIFNQLSTWSDKSSSFMIWDYQNSMVELTSFLPNFHAIQQNIEIYKSFDNLFGVFSEAYCVSSFFGELKRYLISKLLWNSQLNLRQLQTEFVNDYYGNASSFIFEFFDLLDNVTQNNPNITLTAQTITTEEDWFDSILSSAIQLFSEAVKSVANESVILRHVQKTAASAYYMMFFRQKEERKHMFFDWNITSPNQEYVSPINVPQLSREMAMKIDQLLAKETDTKVMTLSADEDRNMRVNVEIEKCIRGYAISYLQSEEEVKRKRKSPNPTTVGFAIEQGARLGSFFYDGYNYINGNFGGIDFTSIKNSTLPIDYVSTDTTGSDAYREEAGFRNETFIRLVRYDKRISRDYRLPEDKKLITIGRYRTTERPVASFALNIQMEYEADSEILNCRSFAFRIDDGDWYPHAAPLDEPYPYLCISGKTILGRKSISFASLITKRGIQIELPTLSFQRILIQSYPLNNTIRVIFAMDHISTVDINYMYEGPTPFVYTPYQFTLIPLTEKDISQTGVAFPTIKELDVMGYKEDIHYVFDVESFHLNESLASFVEDSSTGISFRAAHCYCNSTQPAIYKQFEVTHFLQSLPKDSVMNPESKLFYLDISAKIFPKKKKGVAFVVSIDCGNNMSMNKSVLIEDLPSKSPINSNQYRQFKVGNFTVTTQNDKENFCFASLSCGDAAYSVDVDVANLMYIGHIDEIVDNSAVIIGLSVGSSCVILFYIGLISYYYYRKKKNGNVWKYVSSEKYLNSEPNYHY